MYDDERRPFDCPPIDVRTQLPKSAESTTQWTHVPGPRFLGADVSFEEFIRRMVIRGLPGVRAKVLAAGRDNFADRQGECPVVARLHAQGKVLMEDAAGPAAVATESRHTARTAPAFGRAVFRGQPFRGQPFRES
jgi:hypothetical protein